MIRASAALVACLVFAGLWAASPFDRHMPGRELAVAAEIPGLLAQAASHREALHLLLLRSSSPRSVTLSLGRRTHLGAAGYHLGYGADVLGLVVTVLPRGHNEGDSIVSAHAAVAIPYWLLVATTGLLFLRWSGLLARLKPDLRLSVGGLGAVGAVLLVLLLANVLPLETHHDGVLRDYGFPCTHLRRAVQGEQALEFFMGYDLGWRPVRLGDNLFFAAVASALTLLAWNAITRRDELNAPAAESLPPRPADGD